MLSGYSEDDITASSLGFMLAACDQISGAVLEAESLLDTIPPRIERLASPDL